MTAADLHQSALAALAERRAKVEAATPGPWTANSEKDEKRLGLSVDIGGNVTMDPDTGRKSAFLVGTTWGAGGNVTADAALLVAAVNEYPSLLDLAEVVLLAHYPIGRWCGAHSYNQVSGTEWISCAEVVPVLAALNLNPEEA